jgi:hypothetical protein
MVTGGSYEITLPPVIYTLKQKIFERCRLMLSARFDVAMPTDHIFWSPQVLTIRTLLLLKFQAFRFFPDVLCPRQTGTFLHYIGNSSQNCVQLMACIDCQIAIT